MAMTGNGGDDGRGNRGGGGADAVEDTVGDAVIRVVVMLLFRWLLW